MEEKALLFENTGYAFPVLMNAYGSERTDVYGIRNRSSR